MVKTVLCHFRSNLLVSSILLKTSSKHCLLRRTHFSHNAIRLTPRQPSSRPSTASTRPLTSPALLRHLPRGSVRDLRNVNPFSSASGGGLGPSAEHGPCAKVIRTTAALLAGAASDKAFGGVTAALLTARTLARPCAWRLIEDQSW